MTPTVRALVRRPGPRLVDGLVTHISRQVVDTDLAARQWANYVEVLSDAGWETVEVPPADDCPDATFIEDTVVMFDDLAVACRPGADQRRPEVAGTAAVVKSLGYRSRTITAPGTLDGGDVLKVDRTVYVGIGGRTNHAGADELNRFVQPLGFRVVTVPTTKVLHLKSAVTALSDGTVIGYPPLVDDPAIFERFMAVPEEAGSHVVLLGGQRLLMSSAAPRTADLLAGMGYEPIVVDISEFEKLEGCVTCLSVRLRASPDPPGVI